MVYLNTEVLGLTFTGNILGTAVGAVDNKYVRTLVMLSGISTSGSILTGMKADKTFLWITI